MEATKQLASLADSLFMDCKVDDFSKDKATAYNMLVSAITYLRTGETLIGNRTKTFFEL